VQRLDPLDRQQVRADAADAASHRVDHAAEVLHVRLAGRVVQERRALGQHRRHDEVLGRGHARLVQQNALRLEALRGLEEIGAAGTDRGPEPPEAVEMGVDAAAPDHVAARRIELGAAAARQQRPGEEDRGADLAAQRFAQVRALDAPRADAHSPPLAVQLDLSAQLGEQIDHGAHIRDQRQVAEHHRLGGQQARGQHGQRGVLVARHAVHAADGPAAFNDKS